MEGWKDGRKEGRMDGWKEGINEGKSMIFCNGQKHDFFCIVTLFSPLDPFFFPFVNYFFREEREREREREREKGRERNRCWADVGMAFLVKAGGELRCHRCLGGTCGLVPHAEEVTAACRGGLERSLRRHDLQKKAQADALRRDIL
jgi:hypothetical protein